MMGRKSFLGYICAAFANFSADTSVYSRLECGPECVGIVTLIILGRDFHALRKI